MNHLEAPRSRREIRPGADPSSAVTTSQRQFTRKECTMRVLTILLVLASATLAQAAPMNPGDTLFPAPGEPDPVGAALVVSSGALGFASANYTGTLTSNVYTNDASNPYGLGALTFTYLVADDATSINSLERLTVNGYTGFLTDASYQTPAAGVAPTLIDRGTADVVGFSFAGFGPGVILPGQHSALLVVQTNATSYTTTIASVQDGTIAQVATYSPAPEPASLALTAIGLLAVARRRRK
jgi:PEP-CTERM motif